MSHSASSYPSMRVMTLLRSFCIMRWIGWVSQPPVCVRPSTGRAHTVFATAAKRPAPARGRCLPSPTFVSGAVHSRGATDRAPMLWSGPRPHSIARRAHCGRAGHPPRCPAVHTGCAAPSHHHPPKQAPGCPQPTAAPSGRCGQPGAKTYGEPPAREGGGRVGCYCIWSSRSSDSPQVLSSSIWPVQR